MTDRLIDSEKRLGNLLGALLTAGLLAGVSFLAERALEVGPLLAFVTRPAGTILLIVGLTGLAYLRLTHRDRSMIIETAAISDGLESVLHLAVSELTQMNRELESLSAYHLSILESLPDAVVTVDADGTVVSANPEAERIFGCARAELVGRPLAGATANAEIASLVAETRKSRQTVSREEIDATSRSGEPIAVSVSTALLRATEGAAPGVVVVLRDLSLMKQMEGALNRSERLASLGELAAGVAHEIRNPLNSIRGFAERLANKMSADGPLAQYPKIILTEVDRLNRIVSDIVDFGANRKPALVDVALQGVAEEVVRFVADKAMKQRVKIQQAYESAVPSIRADRQQVKQVLLNLMLNAIDAMPSGGTMTVSLRCAGRTSLMPRRAAAGNAEEAAGVLLAALAEDSVELTVSDTGKGIPKEMAKKLFTPFATTKANGTGLGLSISHRIVEANQGVIEVDSREGQGAAFTVRFPARQTRETSAEHPAAEWALAA